MISPERRGHGVRHGDVPPRVWRFHVQDGDLSTVDLNEDDADEDDILPPELEPDWLTASGSDEDTDSDDGAHAMVVDDGGEGQAIVSHRGRRAESTQQDGYYVTATLDIPGSGSRRAVTVRGQFLVDSGATHSCITLSMVNDLSSWNRTDGTHPPCLQVLPKPNIATALTASGQPMAILGVVIIRTNTELAVDDGNEDGTRINREANTPFLVFEDRNLGTDLLLG